MKCKVLAVEPVVRLLVVLPVFVVVLVMLFCKATVALVGGLMPRVLDLSRLICSTATSTRSPWLSPRFERSFALTKITSRRPVIPR